MISEGFFVGVATLILAMFSYADEPEPIKLKSWTSLKHEQVVQQGLDYSCGAASIATILKYYFGDDWREDVIIADTTSRMFEQELRDSLILELTADVNTLHEYQMKVSNIYSYESVRVAAMKIYTRCL